MSEQTPMGYPADDPETSYPPEAGADGPEEVPANDFENPFAGSPESADAYRAGYREGAFGSHSTEVPAFEGKGLADIWVKGNEAGLRRFAAYRKGFRAGIEAALSGETAELPASLTGDLQSAWTSGRDAGVERAEEIHEAIRHKAVGSSGFDHASGPVHEYVSQDGRWYSQEYSDGRQAIFLHSSGASFALDDRIYPEYERLGIMRRPMGGPISDTLAVGDGQGWYATFQGGEIYSTAEFGAHEVRGKIREFWHSLGPPDDIRSLGYPTSGRQDDLVDGGWAQTFERGDIFQWGTGTPIQLREVEIHYRGMICFGDSDEAGADEPYPVITVLGPPVHHPDGSYSADKSFTLLGPQESALGGGCYPRDMLVYRGRASDVAAIAVSLMESDDEEDKEKYRSRVEAGVRAAVLAVAGGIGTTIGGLPVSALVLWLGETGAGPISQVITDAFGLSDDNIGYRTFPLTPQNLFDMARTQPAPQHEQQIDFHFGGEGTPISDGDASYKVYFDVRFV